MLDTACITAIPYDLMRFDDGAGYTKLIGINLTDFEIFASIIGSKKQINALAILPSFLFLPLFLLEDGRPHLTLLCSSS